MSTLSATLATRGTALPPHGGECRDSRGVGHTGMYAKGGEGVPRRIPLHPCERSRASPPVDHLHPQRLPGVQTTPTLILAIMQPATCNVHHHVQADSAVLVVAANVDMEDPNDDAAHVLMTQAIVLKCGPSSVSSGVCSIS